MKKSIKLFKVFVFMAILLSVFSCTNSTNSKSTGPKTISIEFNDSEESLTEKDDLDVGSEYQTEFKTELGDGTILTEYLLDESFADCLYKIYRDNKSSISDTLMMLTIENGERTEELFGFEPATFLKNIHFIHDEEKSFFTNAKPSDVFITTVANEQSWYYERKNDYQYEVRVEKEAHVRHEICHLLDYRFKFSGGKSADDFMAKLSKENLTDKLFSFVYLTLSSELGFRKEIQEKYSKENNVTLRGGASTKVDMTSVELFAELVTTLDTRYWNQEVQAIRMDQKLFSAYKEILEIYRKNISDNLAKEGYSTDDVEVLKLFDKRISEMNRM